MVPVSMSQSLAVESIDPVTSNEPYDSKFKHTISPEWPQSVVKHIPDYTSQILLVESNDPVAILSP